MSVMGSLAEAVRKGWSIEFGSEVLSSGIATATTNLTIQGAMVCLKTKTALADLTHAVTYFVETATPNELDIYGWKTTSGTDPTMVTATDTETISWIAWGPVIH